MHLQLRIDPIKNWSVIDKWKSHYNILHNYVFVNIYHIIYALQAFIIFIM